MKSKKMLVLIGLLCLSNVSARAGWFSGFGNRIANGVVNTIQNNISGKVNRAVDNAMDGKVGNTAGKSKSKNKKTQSAASVDKNTTEQEKETDALATSTEPVSRITARGKALRFLNDYKEVDLGNGYVLNGERIYTKDLKSGQEYMKVEEFLDPGLYVMVISGTSYIENVSVMEDNQCGVGCGIKLIKARHENPDGHLSAKDKLGNPYLLQVLENTQGRLEIIVFNSQNLRGTGRVEIFKVPEAPKWLK